MSLDKNMQQTPKTQVVVVNSTQAQAGVGGSPGLGSSALASVTQSQGRQQAEKH